MDQKTLWRLIQDIEAPDGISTLSGKQLQDYDDYLVQLLQETPAMGPAALVRKLQVDKQVTTTISSNGATHEYRSKGERHIGDPARGNAAGALHLCVGTAL